MIKSNVKRKNFSYSCQLIGPSKVEYEESPLNINDCFVQVNDTVNVDLIHLGAIKYPYWGFEKEWRYKIIGMPFEGTWKKDDYDRFKEIPVSESLDVNLDQSIFSELVVQLGPRATIAESEIVELILKEYAHGAKLYDSSCKIRI